MSGQEACPLVLEQLVERRPRDARARGDVADSRGRVAALDGDVTIAFKSRAR